MPAISKYYVNRRANASQSWSTIADNLAQPNFIDTDPTSRANGADYQAFGVTATNQIIPSKIVSLSVSLPGSTDWSDIVSTDDPDFVTAMGADSTGAVLVGSQKSRATSLSKYSAVNVLVWSAPFTGTIWINGICVDASDNIYVTGYFIGGGSSLDGIHFLPDGGIKERCFAGKFNSSGALIWSTAIPNTDTPVAQNGDCQGNGIAVSASKVYIAGYVGTAYIGGTIGSGFGPNHLCVALNQSDGSLYWAASFGSGQLGGVAVDASGKVVLAGKFNSANFGGGSLPLVGNAPDICLARIQPDGTWDGSNVDLTKRSFQNTYGSALPYGGADWANGVTVSPVNGDIAMVGNFHGSIDFGNGTGPIGRATFASDADGYLAAFNNIGLCRWRQYIRTASDNPNSGSDDNVVSVAYDALGNVLIGAGMTGPTDFGKGVIGGFGYTYVAKYNSSGVCQWANGYATTISAIQMNGFVTATHNQSVLQRVFFGGYFVNTCDFGKGPVTAPNHNADGFFLSLTP